MARKNKQNIRRGSGIKFTTKTITLRKPKKSAILSLQDKVEKKQRELRKKEKPFVRYSFHIESMLVDKYNIVEEIEFNYKGTLVIPKSQKVNYKPANASVSGTYRIPSDIKHPIKTTDFNYLKRSEIISLLRKNVRKDYVRELQELVKKEILPDFKIISDLPWKS